MSAVMLNSVAGILVAVAVLAVLVTTLNGTPRAATRLMYAAGVVLCGGCVVLQVVALSVAA